VEVAVTYLAWTTDIPNHSRFNFGLDVTGIHHPDGSFKRISFGETTYVPIEEGDQDHLFIVWGRGSTAGGSSGSPLFNRRSHKVMGHLRSGFASCNNPEGDDKYGRFDRTYSAIKRWLEIGGTINVKSNHRGTEQGTPTQPFRTVSQANSFAWDGARIKIQAGHYREEVVFSKQLTILATGGPVIIGR
jgi:hypothetical protein